MILVANFVPMRDSHTHALVNQRLIWTIYSTTNEFVNCYSFGHVQTCCQQEELLLNLTFCTMGDMVHTTRLLCSSASLPKLWPWHLYAQRTELIGSGAICCAGMDSLQRIDAGPCLQIIIFVITCGMFEVVLETCVKYDVCRQVVIPQMFLYIY